MKRYSLLAPVGVFALVAFGAGAGCSDDESNGNGPVGGTTSQAGAAGAGTAGSAGDGGASNAGASGAAGTAGSSGAAGSAAAGAGGSGAGASGAGQGGTTASGDDAGAGDDAGGGGTPLCSASTLPEAPSDGELCVETCTDDCGIFNIGSRLCTCGDEIACDADVTGPPCFDCAGCDFTGVNDPLLEPPAAAFDACPLDDDAMEDDETGCTDNDRCQSIRAGDGDGRFCGCRTNEWDCDSKPDTFAF